MQVQQDTKDWVNHSRANNIEKPGQHGNVRCLHNAVYWYKAQSEILEESRKEEKQKTPGNILKILHGLIVKRLLLQWVRLYLTGRLTQQKCMPVMWICCAGVTKREGIEFVCVKCDITQMSKLNRHRHKPQERTGTRLKCLAHKIYASLQM